MRIYDIVMKLIGPVQPTGDHGTDDLRLENMRVLIDLTDKLLVEIGKATPHANAPEVSVKAIGIIARDFINGVRDEDGSPVKCEHKNRECIYESDDGEFERWRCKDCGETWGVEIAQ